MLGKIIEVYEYQCAECEKSFYEFASEEDLESCPYCGVDLIENEPEWVGGIDRPLMLDVLSGELYFKE